MSTYGIVEYIERGNVTLEAVFRRGKWYIVPHGTLQITDEWDIKNNRSEIIDFLARRQLAASRMQAAIDLGADMAEIRAGYLAECKTDDHRQAFEAGWPETATGTDKEA